VRFSPGRLNFSNLGSSGGTEVSKLIGLACTFKLLFVAMRPQSDKFPSYKAVEAYEIRPGILMMPRYAADGQVCEIGLEKRHYSPELIRLDSTLSRKEIDEIVDELAPSNERGPKEAGLLGDLTSIDGVSLTTSSMYENISIEIYSKLLPGKKLQIAQEDVAATVKWKNRKCR
jgi:hypothetical protein